MRLFTKAVKYLTVAARWSRNLSHTVCLFGPHKIFAYFDLHHFSVGQKRGQLCPHYDTLMSSSLTTECLRFSPYS